MKFSLRWLEDHLTLHGPVDAFIERLTYSGSEVEGVERRGVDDPNVVVAEVVSFVPHPNADRLRLCQVTTGSETRQIVCGAKNFDVGSRVALALPGAKLPGGFAIKESKLRGELSQGMMCSAKELGLADDSEGLIILPPGTPFGPLAAVLPPDTVIDLEITPNRPDILSYHGLARELAALGCGTLKPWEMPQILKGNSAPQQADPKLLPHFEMKVSAPEVAPFYTVALLENVKVGPSPQWLQDKIVATGHKPVNNVVDITNYILWETGQPLHAFDFAKLADNTLEVRFARSGETLTALDDKTYSLLETDLVIADAARPQALAGVIGGKDSAVSDATTTIALESAWFAPAGVRHSGRRLGLLTDSSYRFERRVDPQGVLPAQQRAISLLQELTGATLIRAAVAGAPLEPRPPIRLRPERLAQVVGVAIPREEIEKGLHALGLQLTGPDTWQPPSFRHDLEAEIDLIEEIVRLRGLADLPARVSLGWVPESAADKRYDRAQQVRRTLAARGWQECLTDAFSDAAILGAEPGVLAVSNPINAQFTHLRSSLRDGLLAAAARNVARGNTSVRLFEVGRVYRSEGGKAVEEVRVGLLQLGTVGALEWSARERAVDFYDLKGAADFIEEDRGLGLGAAARIVRGVVDAATAKKHDLKAKAFYAEYHLDEWLQRSEAPAIFQGLPQFPPVRRDLAVVVPSAMPQETIRHAIVKGGAAVTGALERVDLFDVFEDAKGEKIAAGKKSVAYALTYRLPDRTLTDKEVNGWQEALCAQVRTALNCEFREA